MVMSASACGTQGHPLTGPAVSLGKTPPLIINVISRITGFAFIKRTLIICNCPKKEGFQMILISKTFDLKYIDTDVLA